MSSKRYPDEFKVETVKQVTERGYAAADVAKRIGVSRNSLYERIKKSCKCMGPRSSMETIMLKVLAGIATLCLAGCGIESAGTAATTASLKAKEVQQAQESKEQVTRQIDDLQKQADQRLKEAEGK